MFTISFLKLSGNQYFLDDEEESSTDDPSSSRFGRKLELKDSQGRFSIKEKLCSLGLADVRV